MILGGYEKLEIGERRTSCTDHERNEHPKQPFVVLREATLEEMIEQCHEYGVPEHLIDIWRREASFSFFYEVSVD